jgi:transcriptional regulator with XRE-family HTH domain
MTRNPRLEALLKAKALTRADLCVMAGTSASLLRAIERHGYHPRQEAQERLARALDCKTSDLFEE